MTVRVKEECMNEDDIRLAKSIGLTLAEASRTMREALHRNSGYGEPSIRERIAELRQEPEDIDPVKERRRRIEAILEDDTPPVLRR